MERRGVIMVADPDELTRVAALTVAERIGAEMVAFDDGLQLIAHFPTQCPVVAVVEVELDGELTGFEVLDWLHDRFGADLPVILVSAVRTAPSDRVAGLQLGADDYVLKPFDGGEFRARLRRSLTRADLPSETLVGPVEGLQLSDRERQILALLCAGRTQEEIATELFISQRSAATLIEHCQTKLNVRGRRLTIAAAHPLEVVVPDDEIDPT